jgi:hypothetical protein
MTGIEDEGFDMYIPAGQQMAVFVSVQGRWLLASTWEELTAFCGDLFVLYSHLYTRILT